MRDDWQEKRKEWSVKNKYNSFNSYKGLTYIDSYYNPIAKWFKGGRELPPPIELSIDPAHVCNFKCQHCNAQRYLILKPNEVPEDKKFMSKEHLRKLIDFCAKWGVKAACMGGGGEPLMNKNVWDLPSYIISKGMKCSFATNGSLINEQIAEEMMHCRWVGVSIDAGTKEVFNKVHGFIDKNLERIEEIREIFEKMYGKNEENKKLFEKITNLINEENESNDKKEIFNKVIDNLKLLVRKKEETGSKIDIAYKFLIRPDNWHDLYNACKLAKEIGVRDFHARPADLQRKDVESVMELNYNIDEIHKLFEKCHEFEDEKFRVFTIMHKYDPEFKIKHTFTNCVSSSLMLQACADGNVYVCADHRIEPRFKLCGHFPNPEEIKEFWGSNKHRELLQSINVSNECGRCTYGEYARQIEELVMGMNVEDPLCIDFP